MLVHASTPPFAATPERQWPLGVDGLCSEGQAILGSNIKL